MTTKKNTYKNRSYPLTSVFANDRAEIEDHPELGEHPIVFKDRDNPERPEWLRELSEDMGYWVLSYCRLGGMQIIRFIDAAGVDHIELSTVDPIDEDNWEPMTDLPPGCSGQQIKDHAYYLR